MDETNILPNAQTVYRYILDYKSSHDGNSPTIREICCGTGITSTSVVYYYLNHLAKHNLITYTDVLGQSRKIIIPGGRWLPPVERI